jgi:dTDP-4-dehydrorhamnose 3,5-epimerase
MKVIDGGLPGIKIIEPKYFGDHRGYFMEIYRAETYREMGVALEFVQDNMSWSAKGILRGLHFQYPYGQGKLITALQGEVYDVAVDIRQSSPTFGQSFGIILNSENKRQLWIPAGFAHGFQVTTDSALVLYKCDAYYRPDAEKTLLWNDPELGIDWPIKTPQLSDKDSVGRRLRDFNLSELP